MTADQMPMMCPGAQPVFFFVPAEQRDFVAAHQTPMSYMALWPPSAPPAPPAPPASAAPVVPSAAAGALLVPPKVGSVDPGADALATPRTEVPTDSDGERGALRVTASTARRLRRKRAAERLRVAQTQELRVPSMEDFRDRLANGVEKSWELVQFLKIAFMLMDG